MCLRKGKELLQWSWHKSRASSPKSVESPSLDTPGKLRSLSTSSFILGYPGSHYPYDPPCFWAPHGVSCSGFANLLALYCKSESVTPCPHFLTNLFPTCNLLRSLCQLNLAQIVKKNISMQVLDPPHPAAFFPTLVEGRGSYFGVHHIQVSAPVAARTEQNIPR